MENKRRKKQQITRKDFIHYSGFSLAAMFFMSRTSFARECVLTTPDIEGPFYHEGAPKRTVLAHSCEPGERLFISGVVYDPQSCKTPVAGATIELWHANNMGCYSIYQECLVCEESGEESGEEFNLRGTLSTDSDGAYNFETIIPGHYAGRPKHIHFKITYPSGSSMISQIYFAGDSKCEGDSWCSQATDRIVALQKKEDGYHGVFHINKETRLQGDLNNDGSINVADIIVVVGIILGTHNATDDELFAADMNQDNVVNVQDINLLVNTILGRKQAMIIKQQKKSQIVLQDKKVLFDPPAGFAGLQLELSGDYKITKTFLPKNWESYYHQDRMVIFTRDVSAKASKCLFSYTGDLKITSNVVTDWNASYECADVKNNQEEVVDILSTSLDARGKDHISVPYSIKKSDMISLSLWDHRQLEIKSFFQRRVKKGDYIIDIDLKPYKRGVFYLKIIDSHGSFVTRKILT